MVSAVISIIQSIQMAKIVQQCLQPMNIDDNNRISKTWNILTKEPDYNIQAHNLFYELITFSIYADDAKLSTNYSEMVRHTIKNFFKFTYEQKSYKISNSGKYIINSRHKLIFPKEIYGYPTFIHISIRSCPLGFTLSSSLSKCDCNQLLQLMPRVKCHIQDQTITRDGLVWVGKYHGNETVAVS